MTKTPKHKCIIEQNKETLSQMLSGANTVKRLNNINWLRHEISYSEPRALFNMPTKQQTAYLDYNCMTNLGTAYDYIINNSTQPIDSDAIRNIHSILCTNTNIDGGTFRTTPKVIEIIVNGQRFHAPDAYDIAYLVNDAVYKLNNSQEGTPERAFQIHYDLIAIQPFDDFNKRTARMIMNWVLIQGGYRPIVFNQPSDKANYKKAIAAMAAGEQKEYRSYMSACMVRTQKAIMDLLNKSKMY